jgi:hypothetical protein
MARISVEMILPRVDELQEARGVNSGSRLTRSGSILLE